MPCIIKNAIQSGEMKPFTLTLDEIVDLVGENETLTVDVTPDGHGDCIRSVMGHYDTNSNQPKEQRRMFVKPHEMRMSISKFRDALRRCQENDEESKDRREQAIEKDVDNNGLTAYPLYHRRVDEKFDDNGYVDGDRHRPVVYYSKQASFTVTIHITHSLVTILTIFLFILKNDCLRKELAKLFSTRMANPLFKFLRVLPEAISRSNVDFAWTFVASRSHR